MSKRDDPQLRVRIPQELKDELEERARENKRTLTAEIVDRLQTTLMQDKVSTLNTLGYRDFVKMFFEKQRYISHLKFELQKSNSINSITCNKDELFSAIDNLKRILDKKLY